MIFCIHRSLKRHYADFCVRTDFVFLQEIWMTEEQFGVLGLIVEIVSYAGVFGFYYSVLLEGRLFGDCAICGSLQYLLTLCLYLLTVDVYVLF